MESQASKIARRFQGLTYWPTYLALKFFLRFKVEGQENLSGYEVKSLLFASNHSSYLDGPISAAVMPRYKGQWYPRSFFPVRFTALKQFLKWFNPIPFPFGAIAAGYARINACVPVEKAKGDLPLALGEVIKVLRAGDCQIWIYPEGQRTPDGKLGQGKRGIAYLHVETGSPIFPVGIKGSWRISPLEFFLRRRQVTARIGKPLNFPKDMPLEKISDSVMEEIGKLIQ